MVLALNMMDEVAANGGSVRVNEMEAMLGIPVVPISASRGEGIEELLNTLCMPLALSRRRQSTISVRLTIMAGRYIAVCTA